MAKNKELDWQSHPGQPHIIDRSTVLARISDGTETHWAEVREHYSIDEVISDYVRSYDATGYTALVACNARIYRGGESKALLAERDFAIAPPPRTVAINGGWS